MEKAAHTNQPAASAGMKIKQFSAAVSLSPATLYALPAEQRPKAVKVGRSRIIIERPEEFLKRVGKAA